jgi:ketosteroid isomerase-like protein
MCTLTAAIAISIASIGPSFAQKAEIQNANAKWIQLFNKGDFAGIGMLYTKDAVALPPDAGIVKGREAIGAMWKDLAGKVSGPVLNTVEVKRLGPTAARELGHSN